MFAFGDICAVLITAHLSLLSCCRRIERIACVVAGLLILSLKVATSESCLLSTSYISRIITYRIVSYRYVAVAFEVGRVDSKINTMPSNNVCASIKKRVCLSIDYYFKISFCHVSFKKCDNVYYNSCCV